MCYTYPKAESVPSPREYLSATATDLLSRLAQKRTSAASGVDFNGVPFILIGLGFGACILQKVVLDLRERRESEAGSNTHLGMLAGIILLDAPSPSPNTTFYPRSRGQETRGVWTEDWLSVIEESTGTKINVGNLWDDFVTATRKTPVAWHYSPLIVNGRVRTYKHSLCYPNLTCRVPGYHPQNDSSLAPATEIQDFISAEQIRRAW
jgi:hypothetical protein